MTYVRPTPFREAGIGIVASDLVGALWTPDQTWTASGQTFASIGLVEGIFTVADAATGEAITIQVGETAVVPLPAALPLMLAGLGGLLALRRRA